MCGGTSTTTQSTTIPPEVLARYNAVNARAENVANTPFQRYTGEFVAPINQTQQGGINQITQYANAAQPAIQNASNMMNTAYGQGSNIMQNAFGNLQDTYNQANPALAQGQNIATQGYGQAQNVQQDVLGQLGGLAASAAPYLQSGLSSVNNAAAQSGGMLNNLAQAAGNLTSASQPLMNQSLSNQAAAYNTANSNYGNLYNTTGQLANNASPYMQTGLGTALSAYQGTQPAMQSAGAQAGSAFTKGSALSDRGEGYLNQGVSQGQMLNTEAYDPIKGALAQSRPYMERAREATFGGLGAAAPMMGAAEGYLGAGTQDVNAEAFNQRQVDKYMSPYMRNVVEAQQALQQQESAAQRSALNSQAIGAGAFGGDRAGIAQANLARQQSLANQSTLANLLNQGYNQATGMFQQQQGVNLAAAQANRAAQQFGSQQAANLANQRFNQQMTAGQNIAQLGNQNFQQALGQGQALAGLGQQMYAQGLGASGQAASLGQNAYNMGMGLSQNTQNMAQNQFNMGAQMGNMQQATGQNMFNMGAQQAQLQQGLTAAQFAAGSQNAAFQQQAAQNLYNMNAGQLAAQQGIAQNVYNQGLQTGQFQQQTGQNLMANQAQQLGMQQAAGQNLFNMGQQAGQFAQNTGNQQFAMGQQMAGAETALGQNLYNMGSQAAQNQANLGLMGQNAAMQGAQAQIGAGTLEQQTRQAQDTAQYQQFLQERGYPFQVAQFLANIAMGTGALSGSTTTTTQPNSFFSDRRLKKDVKEIGETHDGLPIYSFKYKGGDDQSRIGFMADEVREKHPDAVSRHDGIDAVDYDKVANRESEGGGVMPSRAGQGYYEGGGVSIEDLAAIIAMQKQFLGPHGEGGLYGQAAGNLPGGKGVVPQAALHVARLQKHSAPQQQRNGAQEVLSNIRQAEGLGESLLGDKGIVAKGKQAYAAVTNLGKEQPKASNKETASTSVQQSSSNRSAPPPHPNAPAPAKITSADGSLGVMPEGVNKEDLDPLLRQDVVARGGGIRPAYKFGGGDIYKAEDQVIPDEILEVDTPNKIGESSSGGSGSSKSGATGLSQAIGLAGTAASAGTAIAKFLPALMALIPSDERFKKDMEKVGELDNGQPVYKYRLGDGPPQIGLSAQNVSKYGDPSAVYRDKDGFLYLDYERATKNYGGGIRPAFNRGGDSEEQPRYKIEPIALEDMPEHRQALIREIYGPESGGRYDIRNGGQETFDPNGPHPGRAPAKGGTSSASGAGQFIYDTWQRVTGGAPMTKPYQDNATWTLASQDYNRRTGRDLDEDLKAQGVSPEIKGVLSPTWEAFAKQGYGSGVGAGQPRRQVAPAEYENGKETIGGEETSSGLMPTNFRTGKPFKSAGDFLTDRQFLVPLLTGVGAMASSPSRYFGGALLQGVGAAAQSYGGMEKTQQEIAESQSRTFENTQRAANLSMFTDPKTGYTMVRLSNGQTKPLYEWIDSQEELLGGTLAAEAARQAYSRQGGTPSSGGSTQAQAGGADAGPATTAQAGAGTKPEQKQYPIPQGVVFDDDSQKRAAMDRKQAFMPGGDEVRAQALKYANGVNTAANSAQQTRNLVNEMAMNVANVVSNKGLDAPGFAFPARAQAFEVANFLLKQYDPKAKPFSEADTQQQLADKYNALIATATAAGANQDTLGALQTVYRAMPQTNMSPDAQAQLAAELLVYNRRERDRQAHLQRYNQASMNNPYSAGADFDDKNSKQYLQAIDLIKDVIRRDNKTFSALVKGNVKPELIEEGFKEAAKKLNKPYVPGMSRFFVGG